MRTHLLVDGNNITMRAVHAGYRTEMSADGQSTSALVIFINMLSRYVRLTAPDTILVAFDHPGELDRSQVYAGYKGNRERGQDPDSKGPFSLVREFLSLNGIHHVHRPGVEADDILALAWRSIRQGGSGDRIVVLSGDKDLLQLVDTDTLQIRPTTGSDEQWWDVERVTEHYGLHPRYLSRLMALIGDPTDSVPGVRGVGPKKALKLLTEHRNDLHGLIRQMEATGKWSAEQVTNAQVSYMLIDLRSAPGESGVRVPVPPDFDPQPQRSPELISFLERYQLSQVAHRLEQGTLWAEPESRVEVSMRFDGDTLRAALDS